VAAVNDIAAEAVSTSAVSRHDSLPAAPARAEPQGRAAKPGSHRTGSPVRAPVNGDSESAGAARAPVGTANIQRWRPVAESLVRDGVTSKDSRLVATILAQRQAGVPPSAIGRHHKVHHTTVRTPGLKPRGSHAFWWARPISTAHNRYGPCKSAMSSAPHRKRVPFSPVPPAASLSWQDWLGGPVPLGFPPPAYAIGAAAPVTMMPARQLAAKSLCIMIAFRSGARPWLSGHFIGR
jgi:hypothetical protein